jgi:soluble lytic murein transglycosylase-like protein
MAATIPIAPLSASATPMTPEKRAQLVKAARDFEAIFVQQLMKEMHESSLKPEDDAEKEFMGGMDSMSSIADMEFSRFVAGTGSFGIAKMLMQKLDPSGEAAAAFAKAAGMPEHRPLPNVAAPAPRLELKLAPKLAPKLTPKPPPKLMFKPLRVAPPAAMPTTPVSGRKTASLLERMSEFDDSITASAREFGIPTDLVKAVISVESAGNPHAVSGAKAKGLMQLMDGTARAMGVSDSLNPSQNIRGGTKYLKLMLDEFGGNVPLALAAYNAGPNAVHRHGGIPPYEETQGYVKKVMSYANAFRNRNDDESL